MKREWLLLTGSVAVTVLLTLALLRWFAPQLLGIPIDLQAVRVSERLPPFFDGMFGTVGQSPELLLKDPQTRVRGNPLLPWHSPTGIGPHDILGFRNESVPNVADVITIGDSQTYGNNANLEENWPNSLKRLLRNPHTTVYNMAVGGWGAAQYLDMAARAMAFKPRVIVVAFYSGNDALESFDIAYTDQRWSSLQVDSDVDRSDRPKHPGFPPPTSALWPVVFRDGTQTVLTPALRLVSNNTGYAVVRTGYGIMAEAARRIAQLSDSYHVPAVFTVIPTKELVFRSRIEREGIAPPPAYSMLISLERANIDSLRSAIEALPNATYVDTLSVLQRAAMDSVDIFPTNLNGHPLSDGYAIIAEALAQTVDDYLPDQLDGLVAVKYGDSFELFLANQTGLLRIPPDEPLQEYGLSWEDVRTVNPRDVAGLPILGVLGSGR